MSDAISGKYEQIRQQVRADLASTAAESTIALSPVVGVQSEDILDAARTTAAQALRQPALLAKHLSAYGGKLGQVLKGKSGYAPTRNDKRFQDPAWEKNWLYRGMLQAYLALAESSRQWTDDLDLDEADARRVGFIRDILVDSLAPTNSLLGNPAALRRVLDTGGASLVQGAQHLLDDLRNNHGMPSQVDRSKFKLGENLATTPGKVVFRNEVLELIQYQATTAKVYTRPLLVVPPQINKFYVYDLSPEKSFFRYCVAQGFQVFAVSWRNPGPEQADWGIDTYVAALQEAIAALRSISRSHDINVMGACSGGITTTLLLAYLAALGDKGISSMSLSVCMLSQQQDDSDISLFMNEKSIERARRRSRKKGVLSGVELARVFNWMRPNDLIWNYVVNNYLLGNNPPVFDILYWNNDTTNLPAALHSDFLDILTADALSRPGDVTINETPIDVRSIACDKYIAAGVTDHITPWKACYRSAQLLSGNIRFVLSSSGHIQSLINPPGNPKAMYFDNPGMPKSAEQWRETAVQRQGSWWEDWSLWLKERSGKERNAPRKAGNARYHATDDAPGTYVL